MTGSPYSELIDGLEAIQPVLSAVFGLLVVAALTSPVWLRAVNEVTARTIGKVVVICPHCGVPGVIESTHPKVLR